MGERTTKPGAEQKPRTVVISDGVRVVMGGLNRVERDAVESAFRSASALLKLPVEYVVNAPSGDMYTARATDELRLVYQIKPDRLDVIDLLSAGAVEFLLGPNLIANGMGNRKSES